MPTRTATENTSYEDISESSKYDLLLELSIEISLFLLAARRRRVFSSDEERFSLDPSLFGVGSRGG
jgi:hypothetical protein